MMKNKRWAFLGCLILLIICMILPGMPAMASSPGITISATIVPVISSFTPTTGGSGTSVIITGTNLTGATAVEFGGTIASSYTVDSGTQITAVVGSGSTGTISVITPGGTTTRSDTFTFTTGTASGGGGGGGAISSTTTTTTITPTTTSVTTPTTATATTPTTTPVPITLNQQVTNGTNLVVQTDVLLNNQGISQAAGQIATTDGDITFNVAAGTQMLDAQGQPITEIYASIPTSVPPPPPGDAIMVYYDFGPAGATFNPPLTMTLAYDPVTIPAGVPETSLFIAFYDTTTGQWVVLPGSVVNPVTHTVTAPTSHFTLFSVMSPRSTTATPTTTSAPNWALIMVIIIVVVVVGLLIFFLMVGRRRRKKE